MSNLLLSEIPKICARKLVDATTKSKSKGISLSQTSSPSLSCLFLKIGTLQINEIKVYKTKLPIHKCICTFSDTPYSLF